MFIEVLVIPCSTPLHKLPQTVCKTTYGTIRTAPMASEIALLSPPLRTPNVSRYHRQHQSCAVSCVIRTPDLSIDLMIRPQPSPSKTSKIMWYHIQNQTYYVLCFSDHTITIPIQDLKHFEIFHMLHWSRRSHPHPRPQTLWHITYSTRNRYKE